jgi:hypothetical protein
MPIPIAKMETFPDTPNTPNTSNTPSPVSSPIGDVVTSQPQVEFNDTQSVDFETISNWFSDSIEQTSSSMLDWDSEVPNIFFGLDPEFNF